MKPYEMERVNYATAEAPFISAKARNIRSIPHYHREIEVVRCNFGKIKITAFNRNFELKAGDIIFFMPYEIHSIISDVNAEAVVMKIYTRYKNIPFASFVPKEAVIGEKHRAYKEMNRIIDRIKLENTERKEGCEIASVALVNELLLCLVRNTDYEKLSKTEENSKLKKIAILKNLSEYLEENYTNTVTLESAARSCNMSKFYFSRSFKEMTGMSFTDYLAAHRIEKAVYLMETTDFSNLEIAFSVGFNNYQSYLRAFKKIYGEAPNRHFS